MTNLNKVDENLNEKTKLVWIETPSNPTMKIIDIEGIVNIVRYFHSFNKKFHSIFCKLIKIKYFL